MPYFYTYTFIDRLNQPQFLWNSLGFLCRNARTSHYFKTYKEEISEAEFKRFVRKVIISKR
jgi:hypothetical protein